ncbi:programmed cell death protein 2-like [Sceloporus undulatus]|uniref:programmed cell death protein 2-like n=1 Tax=Sceloporus undulatus TaxID=8520 RepID=UPI001C4CBCDB|nr:programmed cell death protein 2-like [Sceloporus undulatus]
MAALPLPPVLLGLCDALLLPGLEQGLPSKLGGIPDCIPSVTLVHPQCRICGAGLAHLLQISCPLEGSPFQRIIHVFACARKSCWGKSESWTVLRSQYLQEEGIWGSEVKPKPECTVASSDWCEGADDWGENGKEMAGFLGHDLSQRPGGASESVPGEIDCAMQLQDLSLKENQSLCHPANLHNLPCKEPVVPSGVPIFQPYYISVVDEEDYLGYYEDTSHAERLLQEYQQREGLDLGRLMSECHPSGGCDERYEKTEKRDQAFHRFMKRISVCQEQLLRYSWGGEPLFITCPSADVQTSVPPCDRCRSRRVFEFQLMPALVSLLKTKGGDASVEFGTALVYTCEKSCWPPKHLSPFEEFIYVQEDPDQHLFNRTLQQ